MYYIAVFDGNKDSSQSTNLLLNTILHELTFEYSIDTYCYEEELIQVIRENPSEKGSRAWQHPRTIPYLGRREDRDIIRDSGRDLLWHTVIETDDNERYGICSPCRQERRNQ